MYPFSLEQQEFADFKYTFDCPNGNSYTILFASAQDLLEFDGKIDFKFYFLNIIPKFDKPKFDINTSKTIVAITNDFFRLCPECFVFYYPENSDGRDETRSKLFDRWFERHSDENHLRIIYNINIDDTVLTVGLIHLKNNPQRVKAKKVVTNFIRNLNFRKDNL